MRLVFLGPPGAGKGTQAEKISKECNIPHISTGDMLREAVKNNSPVGQKANAYMVKGELVPDQVVIEIVKERLMKQDTKNGFILDGFPRTKPQAESLDEALKLSNMPLDAVLYFKTSDDVVIKRLSGRRVCRKCGATYHIKNIPPKKEGICNNCGTQLIQREDDKEQTVRNRLAVYLKETSELIDYYKNKKILKAISGDLDVNDAYNLLVKMFKNGSIKV